MKTQLEREAEEHAKRVYELEGDSHSEHSEKAGFIAGWRACREAILKRFESYGVIEERVEHLATFGEEALKDGE